MGPLAELVVPALPSAFMIIGWLILLVFAFPQQAKAQDQFPPVPELIFGVNQYNIGPPELEAKYWPLKAEEIEYLKTLGVNTIRFPLYPAEIGLSPVLFDLFQPGQVWDAESAAAGLDWRSLDAVLDQLAHHGITPYISPAAEDGKQWQTKSWMRLHIPEEVEKTLWLTRIVAEHVQAKYGDNVIYGWFEDWFWNTGGHERSTLFPAAWRAALERLYEGDLALLNANWASNYASFEDLSPPVLYQPGVGIPSEAFASRRTFDLRYSIDLMQREALAEMARQLKLASPDAVWAGGCICGELSGWLDTRSIKPVKTNASIRTHALTSDFLTADTYAPPDQYAFYYRTLAKLAHSVGKRYLVAEVSAVQTEAFEAIAEAGGPIAGVLAWVGKEDKFGLFKMDGTLRKENAEAFGRLYQHLANPATRAQAYVPGRVHVYLPEETLEYALSRTNYMEAYFHICDALPARDLEPVLTDELATLPPDTPLFVLEQVLPRRAIEQLNKLGARLICPHRYFVDENGARVLRTTPPGDFYASLMAAEGGPALLEAFTRVSERSNNLADVTRGGKAQVEGKLAEQNVVISGRPNDPANLVDGSLFEGITFSDEPQSERVELILPREKQISSAFVELFAGSAAEQIPASRLPSTVVLSVRQESGEYHDLAAQMTQTGPRLRFKFAPTLATRLRFDFGSNEGGGMRLVELGVLSKSLEESSPPELEPLTQGAIRWDAWFKSDFNPYIEALADPQYNGRLPFFTTFGPDGKPQVWGDTQEAVDQEIAYAKAGGLDYWAFLYYYPNVRDDGFRHDDMNRARRLFLTSENCRDLNFCIILSPGSEYMNGVDPRDPQDERIEEVIGMMLKPNYQTVAGGRPLLYLMFWNPGERLSGDPKVAFFGQTQTGRVWLAALRERIMKAGLPDPYLVVLSQRPEDGAAVATEGGLDAISAYTSWGGPDYAGLCSAQRNHWDAMKATGCAVVPNLSAGWGGPRDGVGDTLQPKPGELGAHLRSAFDWLKANPAAGAAKTLLWYAWNEVDEGGWLVPDKGQGTAKLDELRSIVDTERP